MSPWLRPCTAIDLAIVGTWFDDAETRRWLGNRSWPHEELALAGPDRHALLGLDGDAPVGLIDIEAEPDGTASFAIITATNARRRGIGLALIEAMFAYPPLAAVTAIGAGVQAGNVASERLLLRAGFVRVSAEDADGFSYFSRKR